MSDIDKIIDMMERAQDLISEGRVSEAGTLIYRAQESLRFIRDSKG